MRRSLRLLAAPVALSVVALIGCGAEDKARDAAREKMLDLAEGTWTCDQKNDGEDETVDFIVKDGEFEFVETRKGEKDDTEKGSWKVVDKDIEVKIGDTVARIIDGDGLGVEAGTITVEVPDTSKGAKKGDTERWKLDIRVTGKDKVVIEPGDKLAKERMPGGNIDCDRQ